MIITGVIFLSLPESKNKIKVLMPMPLLEPELENILLFIVIEFDIQSLRCVCYNFQTGAYKIYLF